MFNLKIGAKKIFGIPMLIALAINFGSVELSAAGKRQQPGTNCPGTSAGQPLYTTPNPVREIRLPQIGTKSFQLPNGAQADLDMDMQSILNTAVAASSAFSPTDANSQDPCDTHLELRSAVTTFQLDVVDAGVSFGFSPSGAIAAGGPNISGNAAVKVGMIAMDFQIWQCNGTDCSAVTSSTSTHHVVGGNVAFNLNFSNLVTAAQVVFNPVLAATLRAIMNDGVHQLAVSPRLAELNWSTRVRYYNPSSGTLIMGAGDQSRLTPNQTFEVYAPTDSSSQGACNVFQTVAYVHTLDVDTVSSQAVVDQVLDPRGIQAGDVVMIRNAANSRTH